MDDQHLGLFRMTVLFLFLLYNIPSIVYGNRFVLLEERGSPTRLRFTSGSLGYYNATIREIEENSFACNLKIGMYIYDSKTVIRYIVDPTDTFVAESERIQDFYFLKIKPKAPLNIDTKPLHTLHVKALDGTTNDIIDETKIYLKVTDVNEWTPIFSNTSIHVVIPENQTVGSTVVRTHAEDKDDGLNGEVYYFIPETQIGKVKYFRVHPQSGEIVVIRPLDASLKRDFYFHVAARDRAPIKSKQFVSTPPLPIRIRLLNVPGYTSVYSKRRLYLPRARTGRNIIAAKFSKNVYSSSISEIAPPYTRVLTVTIQRRSDDGPLYGAFYGIDHGNEHGNFQIQSSTGLIYTVKDLDYETRQQHNFSVIAYYHGAFIGRALIQITVTDGNDHDPQFREDVYKLMVHEDTAVGTKILTVSASDKDKGLNGELSYTIANTDRVPFRVLPTTGEIVVSHPLDLDNGVIPGTVFLRVRASDQGRPVRRQTETLVEVTIKPVNNNGPVLKYNQCHLVVDRKTPVGTVVLSIPAIDIDYEGSNIQVYSISFEKSTEQVFEVNASTGQLIVAKSLATADGNYKIIFSVSDGRNPTLHNAEIFVKLSAGLLLDPESSFTRHNCSVSPFFKNAVQALASQKNVTSSEMARPPVKVQQGNYHSPQFIDDRKDIITVSEDLKVGTELYRFRAVDKDLGCYGFVVYSIVAGNIDSNMDIDTYNGTLYIIHPLDREVRASYQIKVRAWDSGMPRNYKDATVDIVVRDVNDNYPTFKNETYTVEVFENVQSGHSLLTVTAVDNDEGKNGIVSYYLVNDYNRLFTINIKTGLIEINGTLDYEQRTEYWIDVQAMDSSRDDQKISQAKVHVIVKDINDNKPLCIPSSRTIEIPKDFPPGAVITRIVAYDPDMGRGGIIHYKIGKGRNRKLLSIDDVSGVLSVNTSLSSEKTPMLDVTIVVHDLGSPVLRSRCHLKIYLKPVLSGEKPIFTSEKAPVFFTVPEKITVGSVVGTVYARSPTDADLNYDIVDGSGLGMFSISKNHGVLKALKSFENSHGCHYWLTVQAYVRNRPSVFTNLPVLIHIQREKANPPYFLPSVYRARIKENMPAGEKVVEVNAVDPDMGLGQSRLRFKIVRGNSDGAFMIKDNGVLVTTMRLDYELQSTYILNVSVENMQNSQLCSFASVMVQVLDENDHAPKFIVVWPNLEATVLEQNAKTVSKLHPQGTPVTQVVALDKDTGANGFVEYSLDQESTGSIFTIDRYTGQIYSKGTLLAGDSIFMEVTAKDKGQPRKMASTYIEIRVYPRPALASSKLYFNQSTYSIKMMEMTKEVVEPVVLLSLREHLIADDSAILFFTIASGNEDGNFYIDEDFKLCVVAKLDYEISQSHKLQITATDGIKQASVVVNVFVEDQNDNRPTTSQSFYEVAVMENEKEGQEVIKVEGMDLDRISQGRLVYDIIAGSLPSTKGAFTIDKKSGVIKTVKVFDHEKETQHVLTVNIQDPASVPIINASVSVVVTIEDVNDHTPKFVETNKLLEIDGNFKVGAPIGRIYASDEDSGVNSMLKFSILDGNDDGYFTMERSGAILLRQRIPVKKKTVFPLLVEVSDYGYPPRKSNKTINVIAYPKRPKPSFKRRKYLCKVKENQPAGTIVSADIRIHPDSQFFYSLQPSGDQCVNRFHVDVFSGVLTTKVSLDAEESSTCVFTIIGKSAQGLSDQAIVTVEIEDVNDNVPTFVNSTFNGTLMEGFSAGSDVLAAGGGPLKFLARDRDSGENARVKYTIVESSAKRYFVVDANTGQLKTAMVLDREKMSKITFHIKASDFGAPMLVSFARVEVEILDINDAMPEFLSAHYTTNMYRPVYNNTAVMTVTAKDEDTAVFGNVTYALIDHQDAFYIDSVTGLLSIRNSGRLTENLYKIGVTASDGIFKSSTVVELKLLPMPNTNFRFQEDVYRPTVRENLKDIVDVVLLQTVGYDVGECVRYTILNRNPYFVVDSLTGIIQTNGIPFDREVTPYYVLIIQGRVERFYPKIAQVMVNVTVTDENDNMPVFIGVPYFKSIDVNTEVGTSLFKVKATDRDFGMNALIKYRILSGGKDILRINTTSGIIYMNQKLVKGRAPPKLFLKVEAYDQGKPTQSASTVVEFPIVNEDMPVFEKNYNITVEEGVALGTVVANIKANGPQGRKVYYSLSKGDDFNVFDIDFNTGELIVTGNIRREVVSKYLLGFKATDSKTGSWSESIGDVRILDINNNIPLFEKPAYIGYVLENATIGTAITTLKAIDKDEGENSELQYSVSQDGSGDSLWFAVDPKLGVVTLVHGLDFEKKREHRIKIRVTDKGRQPLSSQTFLTIKVKDVNDNPPTFDQKEYKFFVDGFWKLGQFIGKVQAFDADSVSQEDLEYSMADSGILRIDKKSGIVTLQSDPGDLEFQRYRVHCSDGKFVASAHVSVRFVPANRQSPLLLQPKYLLKIQEGADPSFITVISATDLDVGALGEIRYSIESKALQKKFHINKLTGEIFSKVSFDREGHESGPFNLPIRAMDGGGRFSYCEAVIEIADQNDNSPIFEYPFYRTDISLKKPIGSQVLRLKAQDKDAGINADITYTVKGLENGKIFTLDRRTGVISLVGEPSGIGYSFVVAAADNGYPMLDTTTNVRIDIVSSVKMRFNATTYNVTIYEDAEPGTWVSTVHAITEDGNEGIEYELLDGNLEHTKVNNKFSIDSNGAITLKGILDYEQVQKYKVKVKATKPSLTLGAYTVVEVDVKNRNDNPPVFDRTFYEVSISEATEINTRVLLLVATDKDKDVNDGSSRIRYKFATADEDARRTFAIDSHTGWITVAAKLDWEKRKTYEFMMKAQDGKKGSGRLMDYTSVRINIKDVNDSPPAFLHSHFSFAIKEDHIVGQKVANVLAEDSDSNPVLRYYITKGNDMGLWSINPENGEINLAKRLDREVKDKHDLEIAAYDGVFKTTTGVSIFLNDTIDNDPICKKAYYVKKVAEGPKSVKPLFNVEVEDPDSSDQLTYSLQGEGTGLFMVDKRTGAVSLVTELDYERQSRYRFLVQATDLAGHSCLSDIIIEVTDINDNAPRFSEAKYISTVRENASVTVMVGRVRATDLDENINRKIKYSLLTDFRSTFSIQESTGILLLEKRLEKDVTGNYSLSVRATDGGKPPLSTDTLIDIIVLGKSDSPPDFEKQKYYFNVSELSQAGSEVGKVYAKSVSDNRVVAYRLESVKSKFVQINTKSGMVSLKRTIDYESVKFITFSVMAYYERVPSLSSAVSVTIHVKDENDNRPVFQSSSYKRKIDENVRPGTFVTSVVATDADEGTNKELRYSIVDRQPSSPFVIDERTGMLSVGRRSQVDREKVPSYRLKVRAEDNGKPKLHEDVFVDIEISDLNDCPPVVDIVNGSVIVQETKPVGSVIYSLAVTDADQPQNGPPFHFSIIEGDRARFAVQRSTSKRDNGDIIIKSPLGATGHTVHRLTVRVYDSGSPPQSSLAYVTVYVVKESKFAPVIQEPTTFFILVDGKKDVFVGKVRVTDADGMNLHQYKITSGNDDGTFKMNDMNGEITGHPREGVYIIGVEVTDGKYTDSGTIKILVNEIHEEIYDNSVVVAVSNIDPYTFVGSKISTFVSLLSRVTGSAVENIVIWAVQKGTKHAVRRDTEKDTQTDVALAIRRPDNKGFISSGDLESLILGNRNTLAAKLGFSVNIASPAACTSLPCPSNKKCIASVIPVKETTVVGQKSQLLSQRFTVGYQCICQNGRTGQDCSRFDVCKGNPCREGERCVPGLESYVCECFDSRKCNLLGDTVTLDGTGYIGYTLITPFDVVFKTIKVSFRTEEKEGILFYAQGPDYCILEIKGGRVQYRFDYGSGPAVVAVTELQVNDGRWHLVEVKRVGKVAFISLDDGKFKNSGQAPGDSAKINLNGNMIFFGAGVISSKPGSSVFDGFKGCIRRPTLNGVELPWTGSNSLVKTATAFSVQARCQDSGMCKKISCPYFSECINTLTSYRCECLPGHKGPFCIARISCSDRPCLNGGRCYYEQVDGKIEYRCQCPVQYSGAQCQDYLGVCGSSPCRNGGSCVPFRNTFTCRCPSRYNGRYCEIDTAPCASSPCLYGTCQQVGTMFQCNCPLGRSGKTCGFGEYCRRTRCSNGGSCIETPEGATCKCAKGFKGNFCQDDINECLDSPQPCKPGQCINKFGGFFCNCSDGFAGSSCKESAERVSSQTTKALFVIVGACGGFIVLVILIAICWCRCCRKRVRKTVESQLSPSVKYPFDFHELTTFPRPPDRANNPPAYSPQDFGAGYLDSTVLYDPQQVGSSGDSVSSQTDSCAKRPLSDDGSEKETKPFLRSFDPSPSGTPVKRNKRMRPINDNDSTYSVDNLDGAYHWDYTGVPQDVIVRSKNNRKLSEDASHLGLPITDDDECDESSYVGGRMAEVVNPTIHQKVNVESRRSSIRDGIDTDTSPHQIPTPQIPKSICLSRQSLPKLETDSPLAVRSLRIDRKTVSETNSPRTCRSSKATDGAYYTCPNEKRKVPELDVSDGGPYERIKTRLTTNEFKNRYSLTLDDDSHSLYLQDMLSYPAPPSEACPSDIDTCTKPSLSETHSEVDLPMTCVRGIPRRYRGVSSSYDLNSATSYSSDDEDLEGIEYLDHDNPRKLEKDLKALFRDIEERTNAEV